MGKLIPDISHYNPVRDWNAVKQNTSFLISKATEGVSFIDSTLHSFIAGCESRKIPYWLYVFLKNGNELAQTKFLVNTCKNKVGKYFCGYVLDIEAGNKEASCIEALNWLKKQSKKTMIYTGWADKEKYRNLINNRGENCAWWEARYGKNDGTYNEKYPCHEGVDLHQYTECGKCAGLYSLSDMNRLTGTKPESWFITPDLQPVSTPTPTTTTQSTQKESTDINRTIKGTGKITASYLNIRTEPDITASKLKSYPVLPKDTQVGICDEITNKKGEKWYFIRYNGKYGFASAKYIKIIK